MLIPAKILLHGRGCTQASTKLTLQKITLAGLLQYISIVYYNGIVIPLIPFVNDEILLQ